MGAGVLALRRPAAPRFQSSAPSAVAPGGHMLSMMEHQARIPQDHPEFTWTSSLTETMSINVWVAQE